MILLEKFMNGLAMTTVISLKDLDVTKIMIMIEEICIREYLMILLKTILIVPKVEIMIIARFMQMNYMINYIIIKILILF